MKEIGRFIAETDTGKEYEIIQYQEYIDASSHDNPNVKIPGLKSMRTANGFHVNFINPQTFKIVETNEIVKKV